MLREIRIALRTLARRPTATSLVVGLLAVGIGADLLIFSLVQSTLLRPLGYPDEERLVRVYVRQDVAGADRLRATEGEFRDWHDQADGFDRMVAASNFGLSITESPEPLNPLMRQVSDGYFATFGVQPMIGRDFETEHHRTAAKVVILDHGFWQSYYGGDPSIVGRTIELANEAHEVIGIIPPSWRQPAFPDHPVLWAPMAQASELDRESGRLIVIGRLAEGVPRAEAERQLTAIQHQSALEQGLDDGRSARLLSLRDSLVETYRPALIALFGAISFMLLIVLGNVAHLLLARAIGRRREMGIRLALGAGGRHLLQQLLTEGLLVGCAGGALGVVLAALSLPVVVRAAQSSLALPLLDGVRLDLVVVLYAFGLSVATGVLCALLPLWHARRGAAEVVRTGDRAGTGGPGSRRWQSAMLVAEVGLSMALLVGAGLMVRTFLHLRGLDLGLDPDRLLVVRMGPRGQGLETPEQRLEFYRRALDQIRDLPGVEAAGINEILPMFATFRPSLPIRPADDDGAGQRAVPLAAGDGYLQAVGTPLLAGRDFGDADRADTEPVVVLSRSVVRSLWGRELAPRDAIGRRIRLGDPPGGEILRVVGVTADLRGLAQAPEPAPVIYRPLDQNFAYPVSFFIRQDAGTSDADTQAVFDAAARVAWSFSTEIPVYGQSTIDQVLRDIESQPRMVMQMLSAFAALALVLTAAGIYAVLTFAVADRSREIGLRVALGATRGQILGWVLGSAGRVTAAGVVLGVALSMLGTRLLTAQLQGVSPFDPPTYLTLAACLGVVSLFAAWLPARRALRVDPARALRAE